MGWLIALGVLALAVFSRGFRAVLVVLVVLAVVAVVAGGLLYVYLQYDEGNRQREREAASRRVALSEVVLDDATLGRESTSFYRLRARARNLNASYSVRTIEVAIKVRDCADGPANDCDTVGQTKESVFVTIPPGQARDVAESIYFSPPPVFRGTMSWSFEIESVTAE